MRKLSSGLIPPHGPSGDGVGPGSQPLERDSKPELSASAAAYQDALTYLKSGIGFEEMVLIISLRRSIGRNEAKLIIGWAARDYKIDLPPESVSESTLKRKPAITPLPDGDDPDGQDKIAKRILASGDIKENFSAMDEIDVAEISDPDDSDNDLAERILRGELGDLTPGDFTAKDE